MNLKKITIELVPSEVQEILRIDMDNDEKEALTFIKAVLAKQVRKSLQPH